ncbi:MAG: glycosyltransferase family 39 protein [Lapillicoccus sp.]
MAADPTTAARSRGPHGQEGRRGTSAAWVLGAVALLPVLAYLVTAVPRLGYPYELTYFEGSTVEVMARVVAGEPLYAAPTTTWTPWPYPPLYFWLCAALAHLTGVGLLPMRLVSLVASLVAFALVALIVRRHTGRTVAGLVAAGLFAATYRVSGVWFDTARVDSLLLALLLLAVYAGMRTRTWRGGLVLGGVLFLAFLTKQNTLIVAAPMLLWLGVRRRPVGVSATAMLGVTVVGSTVLGDLTTDGWYSRYVVHQLTSQAWDYQWFTGFWTRDLVGPFSVSLVVVVVGLAVWWRRGHRPAGRLPSDDAAYLLACVVGLVGTSWAARLHEGGYANVSMPAQAGVAVVVGCLLGWFLRSARLTRVVVTGLALTFLVQAGVMAAYQPTVLPTAADRAAGDRFVATLQRLPGRVLVPTHPYYLRLAGLPTHASAIAIYDIYRSGGGRQLLSAVLPWNLDGVSAVVLDNTSDVGMFGDDLTRQFTLVTDTLVPPGVFAPLSDLPAHPTVLYVRTSELSRLPALAP